MGFSETDKIYNELTTFVKDLTSEDTKNHGICVFEYDDIGRPISEFTSHRLYPSNDFIKMLTATMNDFLDGCDHETYSINKSVLIENTLINLKNNLHNTEEVTKWESTD